MEEMEESDDIEHTSINNFIHEKYVNSGSHNWTIQFKNLNWRFFHRWTLRVILVFACTWWRFPGGQWASPTWEKFILQSLLTLQPYDEPRAAKWAETWEWPSPTWAWPGLGLLSSLGMLAHSLGLCCVSSSLLLHFNCGVYRLGALIKVVYYDHD